MHKSGLPPSQIAKHCEIPVNSVKSILRTFKKRSTTQSLKPSGRPKNLSDRDIRSLVSDTNHERCTTLQEITNNMVTKISAFTLRRALRNKGIHSRIARRKPYLSENSRLRGLPSSKCTLDARWTSGRGLFGATNLRLKSAKIHG